MKLLAEKSFRWKDRKREMTISIAKGQDFEADESDTEEAKDIYSLLQSGGVTVTDDRFIKLESDYTGVHNFEEQRNGTWLRIKPGRTVHLGQRDACRLLVGGFVKPENENSWIPSKLLSGGISVKEPKKMFNEDPVSTRNNWARKGMR